VLPARFTFVLRRGVSGCDIVRLVTLADAFDASGGHQESVVQVLQPLLFRCADDTDTLSAWLSGWVRLHVKDR
jgi:hypothetical protein